jgi:hypothetical protein
METHGLPETMDPQNPPFKDIESPQLQTAIEA